MRCYTAKPRWQWPVHLTAGYNRFAKALRFGTMLEEHALNSIAVDEAAQDLTPPLIGRDGAMALLLGAMASLGPTFARLVGGASLVDAFWPAAVRTLRDEFALRTNPSLIIVVLLIGLISGVALHRSNDSLRRRGSWTLCGVGLGLLTAHVLLDVSYFRGAFLLAPAAYAGWLIPALVHAGDGLAARHRDAVVTSCCLLAATLLAVTPALPAMLGVAPSPPERPAFGYGAPPGPFDSFVVTHSYPLPAEVDSAMTGDEATSAVSTIVVRVPELPDNISEAPIALMFHGFGYPDSSEYIDWSIQLSAKGMVVVQISYPSALDAVGMPEGWEPTETAGASNHPQHALRMLAISRAFDVLDQEIFPSLPVDVRRDVVWVGGHSLGAGIAMMSLPSLHAQGWAGTALVVDLEQPYAHSSDPEVARTLSKFNGTSVAHVAVAEDDTSVGWCHGVAHAKRLATEANMDNVVLMKIQSDRHGFPPLVASHYLAATAVHDALADQALYRRADMQGDWLVAMMRNDTSTASFAMSHLVETDLLSPMGTWSDGTPVKPLSIVDSFDASVPEWVYSCMSEEGD